MIELDGVTKTYRIYRRKSDWLKERLLRRSLHQTKAALRDVSLRVADGEVLGIIGRNGAGKSTLLELIMGVALPNSGEIRVSGRVTGLLELGTGFNSDLTGNENIDFNAALLGMAPDEIAAKRAAIVAFSELGDAIHDPLRTYSSGMTMRLAFAIAIHADPACFVVDEALSVGDVHFQQKCLRRIRAFKANGGTIVFVSHDLNAVKLLCDRAAVLERGEVVAAGDPEFAANRYNQIIARMDTAEATIAVDDPLDPTGTPAAPSDPAAGAPAAATSYGTGEVTLRGARVHGAESDGHIVRAGERTVIAIEVVAHAAIADATLGILIRDRFGQDLFGINTYNMDRPVSFAAGETTTFRFQMAMNLGPGTYSLTVALHRGDDHLETCYHWCDNLATFQVAGFLGARFQGVCRLEPTLEVIDRDGPDV